MPENTDRRILYCHCAFSRVVDEDTKSQVLAGLAESGVAFDAVPDLCELAARQDPDLERLAASGCGVDIVACYPRAVRWLFHAAEVELPEDGVRIHNMRAQEPGEILAELCGAPAAAATPEAKHGSAA
ncbi:MAG: hypothetical protein AAGF23_02565 [Acidobacteriota bacterium]